jgi:hypothetical protein
VFNSVQEKVSPREFIRELCSVVIKVEVLVQIDAQQFKCLRVIVLVPRVNAFNSGDPAGVVRSVRRVFVNIECNVRVYFFAGCMKDDVFSFASVERHFVCLEPMRHFSKFRASSCH